MTDAQRLLLAQLEPVCRTTGYIAVPEHRFAPPRRWRIDVALIGIWPIVAVEIDGGAFIAGRHTRGVGVEKDNEKIAALALHGYRFIRVTPRQVKDGTALAWVRAVLEGR